MEVLMDFFHMWLWFIFNNCSRGGRGGRTILIDVTCLAGRLGFSLSSWHWWNWCDLICANNKGKRKRKKRSLLKDFRNFEIADYLIIQEWKQTTDNLWTIALSISYLGRILLFKCYSGRIKFFFIHQNTASWFSQAGDSHCTFYNTVAVRPALLKV